MSRRIALTAALVAGLSALTAQTAFADPARFTGRPDLSDSQRIERLEAIEEIHELMYAYGRGVDTKNFKAVGALFAPDGTWGGEHGTPLKGPQGIEDGLTKVFGKPGEGVIWNGDFHVFTNAIIELDGDHAKAISKWQFLSPRKKGGARIYVAGHYDDSFVRIDGRWKFASRRVINDIAPPPPPKKK